MPTYKATKDAQMWRISGSKGKIMPARTVFESNGTNTSATAASYGYIG